MRTSLQPCFVLHTRPYRDNSMLVELFAGEHGRVSMVAKGAKSSRTRGGSRAALLQPFTPLLCGWSGRGDLKTLNACESNGLALQIGGQRLFSGLYVNELLVRLLHHEDPHPGLYAEYVNVLTDLAGSGEVDIMLRGFEYRLLEELGYGFDLGHDGLSGEVVIGKTWYRFDAEHGLIATSAGGESRDAEFQGDDLLAIGAGEFNDAARRCAKHLMRRALAVHLGEKPLKSRELFGRQ